MRSRLIPTEREPLIDVWAQISALIDPEHPKRAVWISRGTPFVMVEHDGLCSLDLPTGTLYASEHNCGRLEDDPSEETLARILDYVMPKSACQDAQGWSIFVVQARNSENRVVQEMVVDTDHLGAAIERCRLYGEPKVLSLFDCHLRRRTLIAREDAAK